MRILIIEDEVNLQSQLQQALQTEGYVVECAGDGREGHYLGTEYPYDLAIVDIGLPELSGIEVIQQWRASGKETPVLILTARGRWQEKVEGLEVGADDYMVKPFSMEELLARVRALLRRASGWSQSVLDFDRINLDLSSQDVKMDGQSIELTAYEYKVLEYLMMHAGEVVSKETLTEHIYHQDFDRDSNVIEVFVGRLRKKLDPENDCKPIETLRGRGYCFSMERKTTE